MKFKVYKDTLGEWRWTLYASNGKRIADGSEGYKRKATLLRMIDRIGQRAGQATVEVQE